jgi:hypothetical protein
MLLDLNRVEWKNRYPCWKTYHSVTLNCAAIFLILLGCLSVYNGYRMIPNQMSPRHFVGIPFIGAGIFLLIRFPFVVEIVSLISVLLGLFLIVVCSNKLLHHRPFEIWSISLPALFLVFGLFMFHGMRKWGEKG